MQQLKNSLTQKALTKMHAGLFSLLVLVGSFAQAESQPYFGWNVDTSIGLQRDMDMFLDIYPTYIGYEKNVIGLTPMGIACEVSYSKIFVEDTEQLYTYQITSRNLISKKSATFHFYYGITGVAPETRGFRKNLEDYTVTENSRQATLAKDDRFEKIEIEKLKDGKLRVAVKQYDNGLLSRWSGEEVSCDINAASLGRSVNQ